MQSGRETQIMKESVAAPRLRNYRDCLPKARRLALGLALAAAPQLIAQLTQVTLKLLCITQVCQYLKRRSFIPFAEDFRLHPRSARASSRATAGNQR